MAFLLTSKSKKGHENVQIILKGYEKTIFFVKNKTNLKMFENNFTFATSQQIKHLV